MPLEAFYLELGQQVDTVPSVQVFKTDLYMGKLSPSSPWTRSLPVVMVVGIVFGSWLVLW